MRHSQSKKKPAIPKSRLIIGRKPLLEALDHGSEIEKIFLLQSAGGPEIQEIKKAAQENHIPLSTVPPEKLQRFTQANHQGVVAIAGLISFPPLQEIISAGVDKGEMPLLIILDGITDTRNLGAIARSAYCYGAHALVIPVASNAPVTEDALKTSAGALEHLPVCRVTSIQEALDICRLNGIQVIASGLSAETQLPEADLRVPVGFVLGAEDRGVSTHVLKKADHLIKIPMGDQFDSLNVSVAAGILLYETFRQRSSLKP